MVLISGALPLLMIIIYLAAMLRTAAVKKRGQGNENPPRTTAEPRQTGARREADANRALHRGAETERSGDDCSYAHEPVREAQTPAGDDCAYKHDDILDRTGRVTVTIDKNAGTGTVLVKGRSYPARSLSGEVIRASRKIQVYNIRGGVLIVGPELK